MEKIVNKTCDILIGIGVGLFMAVLFCAGIDVFNRVAVGASITWAQQAAVWLNLFLVFIVAPAMVVDHTHINVTFVISKLKGLALKIVSSLNDLALLTLSVFMAWGGIAYVLYVRAGDIRRALGVIYLPYWIIALSIPLGMSLVFVAGVYMFFHKFKEQKGKEEQ